MEGEHEAGLLARAVDGEAEAFLTLFDAHHAAMFRFAYRLTSAVDAAEDITQECFLRLMRRPGFDRERGTLRQYLYGIVRNLVRQRQQANNREVHWDEDVEVEAAAGPDPIADAETAAMVQAALSLLPPLQREAIVLCEFEELSLEETAAVVGCEVGTVKSRLYRAREGLRRSLAPYRSPKGTRL